MKRLLQLILSVAIVCMTVSCKDKASTPQEQVPEFVDLGLSVKWGRCNLGATSSAEFGSYYQWGDIIGYSSNSSDGKYFDWKDKYDNVTYKWCNGSENSLTKYNIKKSNGTVDNKTILDIEDDAARAALGDTWRIPTDAEWKELMNNCTWTWITTIGGVSGYRVRSNMPGYTDNSIFLPATGFRSYDELSHAGLSGSYWSSSLYPSDSQYAYYVLFNQDGVGRFYFPRCSGFSIRPVLAVR